MCMRDLWHMYASLRDHIKMHLGFEQSGTEVELSST